MKVDLIQELKRQYILALRFGGKTKVEMLNEIEQTYNEGSVCEMLLLELLRDTMQRVRERRTPSQIKTS